MLSNGLEQCTQWLMNQVLCVLKVTEEGSSLN